MGQAATSAPSPATSERQLTPTRSSTPRKSKTAKTSAATPLTEKGKVEVVQSMSVAWASDGRVELIGRTAMTKRLYIGTFRTSRDKNIESHVKTIMDLIDTKRATKHQVTTLFQKLRGK
jgi:hypothetical protein